MSDLFFLTSATSICAPKRFATFITDTTDSKREPTGSPRPSNEPSVGIVALSAEIVDCDESFAIPKIVWNLLGNDTAGGALLDLLTG
mmetsp:Transcript_60240/g.98538  ORF Transcript_60240/g.98538 Transcript_60240/m.98538 type:complete len:87 (-) Transcript_60240:1106-1366(-)